MSPLLTGFIFILISGVGWIAGKVGIITPEGRANLTKVLFYILLPALVASSIMKADIGRDSIVVFVLTMVFSAVLWFLSYLVFRKFYGHLGGLLAMAATMGNTGFLGYPVVRRMLGDSAMPYAIAFSVAQMIVLLFLVYPSLGGRFDVRKLLSPPMVALIVGLILKAVQFAVPNSIWTLLIDTLSMLGSASGPLVMLVIGASLERISFKIYDLWIAGYKIFFLPLAFYVLLKMWVSPLALKTATLQAMTPTLMGAPIYAAAAGLSEDEASRIVAVNTAIFLLLLPLIGYMLSVM